MTPRRVWVHGSRQHKTRSALLSPPQPTEARFPCHPSRVGSTTLARRPNHRLGVCLLAVSRGAPDPPTGGSVWPACSRNFHLAFSRRRWRCSASFEAVVTASVSPRSSSLILARSETCLGHRLPSKRGPPRPGVRCGLQRTAVFSSDVRWRAFLHVGPLLLALPLREARNTDALASASVPRPRPRIQWYLYLSAAPLGV